MPRGGGRSQANTYAGCDHDRKGQFNKGFAPTFLLPTLFPGGMRDAAALSDLTGTPRPDVEKQTKNGKEKLILCYSASVEHAREMLNTPQSPGGTCGIFWLARQR